MKLQLLSHRYRPEHMPAGLLTDAELGSRVAAGDQNAWETFFDRYANWCYRFAYWHLTKNHADAEDLCSDIMLAAARSITSFDPKRGDLDAWVHGLARHRLARFLRARGQEIPVDNLDTVPADRNVEELETRDAVNRALSGLPDRQATALVDKYVNGLSTEEVAAHLCCSPKAAESLLVRARSSFRAAYTTLLSGGSARQASASMGGELR